MTIDTGPAWRLYERIASAMVAANEGAGIEISAQMNAQIVGALSRAKRQVDLLLEARWGDQLFRRIIVDAKHRRRPLDVKDVDSFEGMMRDCRAEHGILVCSAGWSAAAHRRAQDAITIRLLTAEEAWQGDRCASFEICVGPCQEQRAPAKRGVVLWDGQFSVGLEGLASAVITGKCDVCHNFQIWCWECGETFSLGIEDSYCCGSNYRWRTLIEEEIDDPSGGTLNASHLVLVTELGVAMLDRRSLR